MKSHSISSHVWLLSLNIVFERFTQDAACICNSFIPLAQFSSVQLISYVQLFVTPWTAARQASLSTTNSRSLLKLMSIESVMPSNHLICRPLLLSSLFPNIRVATHFPMSQFFASGGPSIGALASASVLPMNIQADFL